MYIPIRELGNSWQRILSPPQPPLICSFTILNQRIGSYCGLLSHSCEPAGMLDSAQVSLRKNESQGLHGQQRPKQVLFFHIPFAICRECDLWQVQTLLGFSRWSEESSCCTLSDAS